MLKTQFTLKDKKILTHDVYELTYECRDLGKEPPKPGQYVMFQLAPGLNRSYSIAAYSGATFTLIIKRISDGRGSPTICDAVIGTVFSGMLPLGHFILRENDKNKCFIGTGTGFAPLYFQVISSSTYIQKPEKIAFIFGVRSEEDIFYGKELTNLDSAFPDFTYTQYLSRPKDSPSSLLPTDTKPLTVKGYVTDWIIPANIRDYEEFYICGSPAMVKSAREKLAELGVEKENIYFEQY